MRHIDETMKPHNSSSLSVFNGLSLNGVWNIEISERCDDTGQGVTILKGVQLINGHGNSEEIIFFAGNLSPTPTPTNSPSLPPSESPSENSNFSHTLPPSNSSGDPGENQENEDVVGNPKVPPSNSNSEDDLSGWELGLIVTACLLVGIAGLSAIGYYSLKGTPFMKNVKSMSRLPSKNMN